MKLLNLKTDTYEPEYAFERSKCGAEIDIQMSKYSASIFLFRIKNKFGQKKLVQKTIEMFR